MQPVSWQESLNLGVTYAVAQVSAYLPRILAAVCILLLGLVFSKMIRKVVSKALGTIRVSSAIEKTPLELFLKNADVGHKFEDIVAGIVYWLSIFLTLYTAVSVLGLTPLTDIFQKVIEYIPHVFSALFIFILGVVLAGVVETVIKGAMKGIDVHSTRLFAKVASYLVVTIGSLAAIAELGIASQFIMVLFVGVVFAFSLAAGLSIGLGSKQTVEKMLENWQKSKE